MIRSLLILLLKAYRCVVSPWFGARCRFYPSCSQYSLEALETHGCCRGLWLTMLRLGKCHPFHAGGVDLVPPRRLPRK